MATDATKVIRHLKTQSLKDQQEYPDWKLLVEAELGCVDLAHYIRKPDYEKYLENKETYLKLARQIYCYLLKCLDKRLIPLVRFFKNFTLADLTPSPAPAALKGASVESSKNEKEEQFKAAIRDQGNTQLMDCPHPFFLWKTLQDKFEANTPVHLQLLVQRLCHLKMGGDFDLYAAELDTTIKRLEDMGELFSDRMKKAFLVQGLPEQARAFAAMLEESDSSKAYELIRGALSSYFSEEKARGKDLYSDNTGHAFATRPSRSGAPSTVPVCNHCKKLKRKSINHKEEDCYMLHPEKEMEFLKKKSEALRKKLEDLNKKSEGSEGSALSVLGTKSPANAKLVPYFYRQVEL